MVTACEKAIDKLSSNFPVYKLVPVAGKSVEAEIFIPNFGYATFISGSEEIRVRTCADASAVRLVKVASVLSPFGTIVESES